MNLIFLNIINFIYSHSNLSFPPNRGNKKWWGYCSRGLGCMGACEAPKAESKIKSPYTKKLEYKRGQPIEIKWSRQNHPGGFVRLSIVPFSQSDNAKAFDNNIVAYSCYNSKCKESKEIPMFGKWNGSGTDPCNTRINTPDYLPDGPVTLQWTWFGGGVFQGDKKGAFAEYVSCSDFYIKGGKPLKSKNKRYKPPFLGGELRFPKNDQCSYWSSKKVHKCIEGAEKLDKNGCGYGEMKSGKPEGY